ncbi:MAG: GNAT family N-acetyltransferase [candidate division Zixibacteria bacterium]|nr:GNAT family N-acetyltransferase [candidate division Zixibacteria bacterium]
MKNRNSRLVFLKGKKTILRPLRKATDFELCLRWINDPEVNPYLLVHFPVTEKKEKEWFDNLANNPSEVVLGIETLDGRLIGTMGLHRINNKDRTAMTGALIGEKEYWGKGYGTDAKMTILDYAFNTLNLRKVNSSVYAFNKRSLKYNLKCGYKVEGVRKKQIFRNGKYNDEIVIAVFKEDWLPIWKKYQKTAKIRWTSGQIHIKKYRLKWS